MNGIVLDTDVGSEPKRPRPDPAVRAWFERQNPDRLFLTTTVICELAEGIERIPAGRGRCGFEGRLGGLVAEDFRARVLVLDVAAARLFGRLVASACAQGRPPRMGDAQIAAVAARDDMAVATRDAADFEPFGVSLVYPRATD